MKSVIITFPGTNRENDMSMAIERASGKKPTLTWYTDKEIPDVDLIVIPGGFSYGDYLRSGAMAARSPAMQTVAENSKKGVPVLGVCNGFQILTEAGLLPGALIRNSGLKFICKNVNIRVEQTNTIFTSKYFVGQNLSIPVAHNDGNYFAEAAVLDELENQNRVIFRYVDSLGAANQAGNPNGSARNIAGISNKDKNVLGFMPHPENATDPRLGSTDGQSLFESLMDTVS
ncbi:MAG: phosphoribosylformylglycinamidine synthase I [Rhodospirillaceae bacterium]|nr:phosphoribosylformylglycinamidine synthase I [Rhodospirillaceae bacterium]|tara:strand:- start:4287 stop:4976 length:690 start_codon:yes stop_codon:yes gene_type:complete